MGSARGASLAAVLPQAALRAMSCRLPESAADMRALPYVTRANYDKYGDQLLQITAAYSVEKMGLLMQYQDEIEQDETKAEAADDDAGSGSDTDWSREAQQADSSTISSGKRGRRTYRGGVRKRFKRKQPSSAKKRAIRGAYAARGVSRGASSTARGSASRGGSRGGSSSGSGRGSGGSKLGSMPVPRTNTAVINTRPGVFNPSKLNLI